ncbi:Ankyrin repeat domain-containing protein 54 [Smittium mucronatum]|uniref:Ankyrin repeat domain-containing protein 54 n=1 Tax=Smittium mucronatum TaxID=133383 RepID=A0A1R0GZF0_9FUNG|nr:Ankyrin repeat domain-containing protein 54 [Smittium mucronatum]
MSDTNSDSTFNGSEDHNSGFSKYKDSSKIDLISFSSFSNSENIFSSASTNSLSQKNSLDSSQDYLLSNILSTKKNIYRSHNPLSKKNNENNDSYIEKTEKNLHKVNGKQGFKQPHMKKIYSSNTRISELIIQDTKPEFIDNFSEMNANSIIRYSNDSDFMDLCNNPSQEIHGKDDQMIDSSICPPTSCSLESSRSISVNPLVNFESNSVFYSGPERSRKPFNNPSSIMSKSFNSNGSFRRRKAKGDQKPFINAIRKWANSQLHVDKAQINLMAGSDPEEISQLVESGANFNASDEHSRTALHVACSLGNIKAVEMLLGYGCDPNSVDIVGNTPLNIAAIAGHTEIVLLLLQFGADPRAGRQRLSPSAMVRLRLKQLRAQIRRNRLLIKPLPKVENSDSSMGSNSNNDHQHVSGSKSRTGQFKATRSKAYMISQECYAILRILQYYVNSDFSAISNFKPHNTKNAVRGNSLVNNNDLSFHNSARHNGDYIDPTWVAYDNKDEVVMPITKNTRKAFNDLANQLENFQLFGSSNSQELSYSNQRSKTFNFPSLGFGITNPKDHDLAGSLASRDFNSTSDKYEFKSKSGAFNIKSINPSFQETTKSDIISSIPDGSTFSDQNTGSNPNVNKDSDDPAARQDFNKANLVLNGFSDIINLSKEKSEDAENLEVEHLLNKLVDLVDSLQLE